MYLHEAAEKARSTGGYMHCGGQKYFVIEVPAGGPCPGMAQGPGEKAPRPFDAWNPTYRDLVSDQWEVSPKEDGANL